MILLGSLLNSVTIALERAAEEKSLLLNRVTRDLGYFAKSLFYYMNYMKHIVYGLQIRDINELSRQEVDEIINMCARRDCVSPADNIQKR